MPAKAGTQNSRRHVWLTAYVPLIIWTFVVLGLGSGIGSMNETSRIIRPLLEFIFPPAAPETLAIYHGYIRKLAHFVEYAVLAFFAFRAFGPYKHRYGLALALAASIAALDEFNQSLNPARTSSPWDVALDVAGAAFTIAIFALIAIRRRSMKRHVDQ
jgi:VanZ family protein